MRVLILVFNFFLLINSQSQSNPDTYEFGFTIDGQQHRHEKKDVNGIIQGEFGFITADGVYHVTVYATDENGNFRILSTKNIRISAPLDGSGLPPGAKIESYSGQKAPQPQPNALQIPSSTTPASRTQYSFTTQSTIKPACGGCGYVTTPKPKAGLFPFENPTFQPISGTSQPAAAQPGSPSSYQNQPQTNENQAGSYQNQPGAPAAPTYNNQPGAPAAPTYNNQPGTPGAPTYSNQPGAPAAPIYGNQPGAPGAPAYGNQPGAPGAPTYENQPGAPGAPASYENQPGSPGVAGSYENQPGPYQNQPGQGQTQAPYLRENQPGFHPASYNNQRPIDNGQPSGSPQGNEVLPNPLSSEPETPSSRLSKVSVSDGAIHVPGNPDIPIKDKYPGMQEGLPEGIGENDIKDLLYKFNYTVGFHGHYEKGYKNGAKIGGYFVNGRDGLSRIVTYVADENGFRPKVKFLRLGLDSPDTPNEATEKSFGLKNFEFVWYPIS